MSKVYVVVEIFDNREEYSEDRIIDHGNIAVCKSRAIANKLIDKLVDEKVKFAYANNGIPESGIEDEDIKYVRIKWTDETPLEAKGMCHDFGEWTYGYERLELLEES